MRKHLFVIATVSIVSMMSSAATAQKWPPDSLVNLQVFPKDIPIPRLVGIMRGFAFALGVRCIHCHVGDDPNDLSTTDFVSDDRPTKRKAREMIRMARTINEELLAKVPDRSDPPVEVRCATCHHGLSKPADIRDVLAETARTAGFDSMAAQYKQLHEEYYGSDSYDFRPFVLANVAESVGRQDGPLALEILDFNLTMFPKDAQTFLTMAGIYQRNGDRDALIKVLERAIEAVPDEPFFRRMLERAQSGNR